MLTNEASGEIIALLGRFDYNKEGAAAEKYRQELLRLSERHAEERKSSIIAPEDIRYAASELQKEVVM